MYSIVLFLTAFVTAVRSVDLVQVNYYAESLCPDCIAFSTGPMNEAIRQVGSIFSLRYVPSGNAHLQTDGTIACQHGATECLINKVEACTIHYYSSREQFWPFIYCMDKYGELQNLEIGSRCAKVASLDWDRILSCTNGELGNKLQMKAFNETAILQPPHTYTPWVTINGKHNVDAEGYNLISVICQNYNGARKPSAC